MYETERKAFGVGEQFLIGDDVCILGNYQFKERGFISST